MVVDVGAEHENRLSTEEHDQIRSELRLQRPTSVHAGPSRAGGGVGASGPGRHRQLPGGAACRPLPRRDVRLRLQLGFVALALVVAASRLADTVPGGRASGFLGAVPAATSLPWQLRCPCVFDAKDGAVLDRPR